MTIERIKEST